MDPLKHIEVPADLTGMAAKEAICPTCDADIPLAGDEKSGDEVFCTVCGVPSLLKGNPGDQDFEVEEDF